MPLTDYDFTLTQGDDQVVWTVVMGEDGLPRQPKVPIDLTNVMAITVTFQHKTRLQVVFTAPAIPAADQTANIGEASVTFTSDMTANAPGEYWADFFVVWNDGRKWHFPSGTKKTVRIYAP